MNRKFSVALRLAGLLIVLVGHAPANAANPSGSGVRSIGSRLELFVDDWLIEQMQGVMLELHAPVRREVAIRFNKPWEGIDTAYVTIMKDGPKYRMYYRGDPPGQNEITCYAESSDGIVWTKTRLGLFAFNGSKENNIVWSGPGTHNFTPFKDVNPAASDAEKYKAVGGGPLLAFVSADGIHWGLRRAAPIITKGAFDSQNLVFWDTQRSCYAAYFRGSRDGKRDILTCISPNFIDWTEPVFLNYGDAPREHFYTNAITPYFRAPHIYLGFPKRFVPERKLLTEQPEPGISDGVFMTSRDGSHWDRRFQEAFIRPGLDRLNWMHRSNMTAWGIVATSPEEISIYFSEHYNTPKNQLRRGSLRTDGFASVHAPAKGGEMITRPFIFAGRNLVINFATSAAGTVRAELQEQSGKPVAGFTLAECDEIYGDAIERTITWKKAADLHRFAGKSVRLRFSLRDADLYSMRFRP